MSNCNPKEDRLISIIVENFSTRSLRGSSASPTAIVATIGVISVP